MSRSNTLIRNPVGYHDIKFMRKTKYAGSIVCLDTISPDTICRGGTEVTLKYYVYREDPSESLSVDVVCLDTGRIIHAKLTSIECDIRESQRNANYNIFKFTMPNEPVRIISMMGYNDKHIKKNTGGNVKMEPKNPTRTFVNTVKIPEELAKRLSELLITQTIRERMLNQNIDNPSNYEKMEKMLIPVVTEIEAIKAKITRECIPDEYRSDEYMWNYDGYEIDGSSISIFKA